MWDANEVKALFIKELDKLYGPGGPNKDMHERAEEMERMREHVFQENDKNRDGLIDFQEFMLEAKKSSFNQDEGKYDIKTFNRTRISLKIMDYRYGYTKVYFHINKKWCMHHG